MEIKESVNMGITSTCKLFHHLNWVNLQLKTLSSLHCVFSHRACMPWAVTFDSASSTWLQPWAKVELNPISWHNHTTQNFKLSGHQIVLQWRNRDFRLSLQNETAVNGALIGCGPRNASSSAQRWTLRYL